MSDPHSPRPATQHELDVAADALHLARYGEQIRREYPTFLHGEGSDMQDNCYEEANAVRLALAAFPAADPAASADADAAWEALWTDLEPGTQRDHARRHRPIIEAAIVAGTVWDEALGRRSFVTALDEGLADVAAGRTRPWADVRAAVRSAGTPPASTLPPCGWCGHADDQHGNADPECSVEGCRCVAYRSAALRAIRSAGTPPASRETLDDLRESHRHIRRAGFPEHRPDVECYCDTCWGYLADEAGGDPERRANDAS